MGLQVLLRSPAVCHRSEVNHRCRGCMELQTIRTCRIRSFLADISASRRSSASRTCVTPSTAARDSQPESTRHAPGAAVHAGRRSTRQWGTPHLACNPFVLVLAQRHEVRNLHSTAQRSQSIPPLLTKFRAQKSVNRCAKR
jgi:hypothetical protein